MANSKKTNIVLITADQWRGDCLGCLPGRQPVMTPHVNQLAEEGTLFTQAFADCPVCMPQRVTTLTGQVASHVGLTDNFWVRSPIDPASSLPTRLSREAGYQTEAIGKMHFSPPRARFGFDHIRLHPNDYVNWLDEHGYAGMYRGHGLGGTEVYPAVSAVPERFTHTHWVVDEAINFLGQRDPDAPFFLWLVFEAPHSPFDPPEPYDRMYDRMTIPDEVRGDWVGTDDDPVAFRERRISFKWDQISPEVRRESRRRYFGQITHIDYQLGRFFGELKSRGMYDDTAIIFTSDHGEHLGDHGLYGKFDFLHGSCDVPLIVRLPRAVPALHPALRVASPVLTADIHPTLLQLAGLQPAHDADGTSLLPLIEQGGSDAQRTVCGECSENTAFAMDGRFIYIYYPHGGVEHLFDLDNDRQNLRNLSHSHEHEAAKRRLRGELTAYLERFGRPMVKSGQLATLDCQLDEFQLRGRNPFAWRGPIRYGQGYGGGW